MDSKDLMTLKGIYRDRLVRANGDVVDFGWRSNVIVNQCREMLAAFVKGETSAGIQHIAIGTGNAAWDTTPPPPPTPTTNALVDTSPFIVSSGDASINIDFLNAANEVVTQVTNRIQFTVTLEPGVPPPPGSETSYPLREFALFGQVGTADYMIDYVRHPVINKEAADTLTRTIRLGF